MVRLFTAAALTLLAVFTYRNARRQLHPGEGGENAAAPRPLQTWEGEGGGVATSNSPGQTLAQVSPADASGVTH